MNSLTQPLVQSLLSASSLHTIPTFFPYPFQREVWNRAAAAVLQDRCGCPHPETCPQCSQACRRFILVWHRRSGKDFLCWQFAIWTALASQKARQVFYCLPTFSQCRRVIFESKDLEGNSFLSVIPQEFIVKINNQDLTIHLINGSVISLISSNSYDKIRGSNAYLVVLSEFAFYSHQAQKEILNVFLPIVGRNQGILILNSTPNSRNYFYDLYEKAKRSKTWYTSLVSIDDTQLVTKEYVQELVDTGVMSKAKTQQEFYCDFEISESTIYAKEMEEARSTNRIGCAIPDPHSSLSCAFDIGIADKTFCLVYEYNSSAKTLKIFDECEGTGHPFIYYLELLRKKSYSHRIADLFLPMDAKKRNQNDGLSLYSTAKEISERWNWLFRTHLVDSNQLINNQVDFCRTHFSRVWIHESSCPLLIKCLDNYSMIFDEKNNVYTKPRHDQYSHGASVFSYTMMSMRRLGRSESVDLDKQLFEKYRPKL